MSVLVLEGRVPEDALAVREPGVVVAEGETLELPVSVVVVVSCCCVAVLQGEEAGDAPMEALGVPLGVAEGEGSSSAPPEGDTVPVGEPERVLLPVVLGDSPPDVAGGEGGAATVVEAEGVAVPEAAAEAALLLLALPPEGEAAAREVTLALGLREVEPEGVLLPVGVALREAVAVTEGVEEGVRVGVGVQL